MSEMTAWERINQEVYEAYQAGIDHECVPHKYPPMLKSDIVDATSRILAIVREAMLSDEAAVAFTGSAEGVMVDGYRRDISDALDAVFGEETPTTPPR